jgi:AcrR family transcriptional regulator
MKASERVNHRQSGAQSQGRPRDPNIDSAVLRATLELLQEVGYNRLTIPQVAARAGATPPAVYRRFPSKMELVYEAVFATTTTAELPLSDDLGSTMQALVRGAIRRFGRPAVHTAAAGLMADLPTQPGLSARLVAQLQDSTYRQLQEFLDRMAARGRAKDGVDARMLADLISGMVMMAWANERDLDDIWIERAAALIVDGLAR